VRSAIVFVLLLGLLCQAGIAVAQPYPNHPVTLIVPSAPGGLADVTARPFAAAMGRVLGQNFVVDPKPGAGGAVGIAHAGRQKNDGYTLLWALNSFLSIPEVDRIFGRAPSFQVSQFTPIALLVVDEPVLAARADAPWRSMAELLAEAKARPGQITYGTAGVYSTLHVPMELLLQSAGVKMLHVPFQGAGPALLANIAGQIDLSVQAAGVAQTQVRAGKLRLLGSFGSGRSALFPEVPTFREQGIDVDYAGWIALFAPAGTPAEALSTLRGAAKLASQDPAFMEGVAKAGSQVRYVEGAGFQTWFDAQAKKMAEAVRLIGKVE
jgi:tripartite-type tricarboxylate transporter receptor subunit TctC